jgi:hypothetical protein
MLAPSIIIKFLNFNILLRNWEKLNIKKKKNGKITKKHLLKIIISV